MCDPWMTCFSYYSSTNDGGLKRKKEGYSHILGKKLMSDDGCRTTKKKCLEMSCFFSYDNIERRMTDDGLQEQLTLFLFSGVNE